MKSPLRVLPAALVCLLLFSMLLSTGCRTKPAPPGSSIPSASSSSAALPGSNTASDAPSAPAVAQSSSGSVTTYSDPATGVSFRYPSSWRPWHAGVTMYPPTLAQNGASVKITQVFDPQGTDFASTNLIGLSFSYAARPQNTRETCAQLAQTLVPGGRRMSPETINGLSFTRYEAGDAGMCHQMTTSLNSTVRSGTCYLFERDFETVCPDVRGVGNSTALTASQRQVLQGQLDRVMQSVVLQ